MIKDKNQKGVEKEKQREGGGGNRPSCKKKRFDLEVIKMRHGRGENAKDVAWT